MFFLLTPQNIRTWNESAARNTWLKMFDETIYYPHNKNVYINESRMFNKDKFDIRTYSNYFTLSFYEIK